MNIRKLAMLAAVAALGLLALGSSMASATQLRTDPTGAVLPAGSTISNTASDPATLVLNGLGSVNCTNTAFAGTAGGTAATLVGALTSLSFTTCTDSIPVITITSCAKTAANPVVNITATGAGTGSVNIIDATVFCSVSGGSSGCYYTAATANGNATNTPSAIRYAGVSVAHNVPAGATNDLGALCGSTGSFSAAVTGIVSGGSRVTIF